MVQSGEGLGRKSRIKPPGAAACAGVKRIPGQSAQTVSGELTDPIYPAGLYLEEFPLGDVGQPLITTFQVEAHA